MKKKKKKSLIALIIIFLVLTLNLVIFYPQKPSNFSTDEHIERISKLVEKRYINESKDYKNSENYTGVNYTDFEVFPLYDESEKINYYLVELEPYGYVYVCITDTSYMLKLINGRSMYSRCGGDGENLTWNRYRIANENNTENLQWKNSNFKKYDYEKILCEVNENGDNIFYDVSHYKAANIENEKRYLLNASGSYIPAVKRGDKYLNLISMQEINYSKVLTIKEVPALFLYTYPNGRLKL